MSTINMNIKVVHENDIVSVSIWELVGIDPEGLSSFIDQLTDPGYDVVDEDGEWEIGPLMDVGVHLVGIDYSQDNCVFLRVTGIREWTQYREEKE